MAWNHIGAQWQMPTQCSVSVDFEKKYNVKKPRFFAISEALRLEHSPAAKTNRRINPSNHSLTHSMIV